MYHVSNACGSHTPLVVADWYINALIPTGANGVLLKLNSLSNCEYANSFLLILLWRSIFKEILAYSRTSSHKCMTNWLSTIHNPAIR